MRLALAPLSPCCPAAAEVLGEAWSLTAHMRVMRCSSCERSWQETSWVSRHPPRGWVSSLARHLAELDERARRAAYS